MQAEPQLADPLSTSLGPRLVCGLGIALIPLISFLLLHCAPSLSDRTTTMSLPASPFAGKKVGLPCRSASGRLRGPQVLRVEAKESRIGKQPVTVPAKVEVTIDGNMVKVKASGAALALRTGPVEQRSLFFCRETKPTAFPWHAGPKR
jgi:hypothetical protein